MEALFSGLFTSTATSITLTGFIISIAAAIVLGAVVSLVFTRNSYETKSFAITLALIPAIVAIIIMMVSGSLGAGVAVAGTFSLIRFRSAPGTAKEIGGIFLAMASGLACGMGYPVFAAIFTVIICAVFVLYSHLGFGSNNKDGLAKTLKITVPEDLEYEGMFSDIFDKYTKNCELAGIKTTNMGSMNKLTYNLTLKEAGTEKRMIDDLRCRNGNLEIALSLQQIDRNEL